MGVEERVGEVLEAVSKAIERELRCEIREVEGRESALV